MAARNVHHSRVDRPIRAAGVTEIRAQVAHRPESLSRRGVDAWPRMEKESPAMAASSSVTPGRPRPRLHRSVTYELSRPPRPIREKACKSGLSFSAKVEDEPAVVSIAATRKETALITTRCTSALRSHGGLTEPFKDGSVPA